MNNGITITEEETPRFHLCEKSTIFARLATALSALVLVLHIVAVASPYWTTTEMRGIDVFHAGLWIECTDTGVFTTQSRWSCDTYSADHHLSSLPVFLKASQGLAILGMLFLVSTLFLLCLYTILPKLVGRKIASFIALALVTTAGIFIIIGAIVYAAEYPTSQDPLGMQSWDYGFAFALEFVVGILSLVVSALILVDMRQSLLIKSLRFF